MIKNIIFDIGRVLLEFEPIDYLKIKFMNDHLVEKLYTSIFCSLEWVELDRGSITDEEAIKTFCERNADIKSHIIEVMHDWTSVLKPIAGTVEILEKLKSKGYKIYLLSNFHSAAFEKVYDKYSFLRLADGLAISSRINLLKPSKDIYKYLLDTFSLDVKESIFIDDTPANVEAANSIGINSIQFHCPKRLKEQLEKYSVIL